MTVWIAIVALAALAVFALSAGKVVVGLVRLAWLSVKLVLSLAHVAWLVLTDGGPRVRRPR